MHKIGALVGSLAATGCGLGPPSLPLAAALPPTRPTPSPWSNSWKNLGQGDFYYIGYFLCSSEKYQLLYLKENCILLTLIINLNSSLLQSRQVTSSQLFNEYLCLHVSQEPQIKMAKMKVNILSHPFFLVNCLSC